jgi:hypothetical protein
LSSEKRDWPRCDCQRRPSRESCRPRWLRPFCSALASWAGPLHADYLAFVIIRGAILTQGAQSSCRGEIVSGVRRAGLVVVELATGRIVRFRAMRLEDVDTPRIAEGVGKLMDALDLPGATTK